MINLMLWISFAFLTFLIGYALVCWMFQSLCVNNTFWVQDSDFGLLTPKK